MIRYQLVSASRYVSRFNAPAWHMSSDFELTNILPKVDVRTGLSEQTLVACICCSCSTARRSRLFSPTFCSCRQAIQPVSGHPSFCLSPLARQRGWHIPASCWCYRRIHIWSSRRCQGLCRGRQAPCTPLIPQRGIRELRRGGGFRRDAC